MASAKGLGSGLRVTRRTALGAGLAAASLAAAYAALGDPAGFLGLGDEDGPPEAEALSRESVRVSHLLRRAGFGVTRDEYEHYQSLGLEGTLDELLHYEAIDDSHAVGLAERVLEAYPGPAAAPLWWLVRMANTRRPLQEKMTLFWHGLLTSQFSQVRDPQAMIAQNELLRSHALGSFPELLRAVTFDPAMMVYLDMDGSQRSAPNENYARELMELFALGVGNYTEDDVREAARAFTGWQVTRTRGAAGPVLGEPVFRPPRFDNGAKTVLGETGNFDANDVIDIVVRQPASSRYVTRRLFSYFVYPDPSDADLEPFVEVYESSDRSIGAVMEALFRSDVFYSPRAYRAIVKSPVEYVIGAVKALGRQEDIVTAIFTEGQARNAGVLGAMGQVLFEPPNVAGWPGNAAWLNSSTLFARLNFIDRLTAGDQARALRRDRRPVTAGAASGVPGLGTAYDALAHYLPMLLDDNLPQAARAALLEYAGGGAPLDAEGLRSLVYLVLASPQFHLT